MMEKTFISMIIILGFGYTAFSQNNHSQEQSIDTNKVVNYQTIQVVNEGTNDPLQNGYALEIIGGKEIYVKRVGQMVIYYDPKK